MGGSDTIDGDSIEQPLTVDEMAMEPVLDLRALQGKLEPEMFAYFLERLCKTCIQIMVRGKILNDPDSFTCHADPSGIVRMLNRTRRRQPSLKAELFDLPPDVLRRVFDEAVRTTCGLDTTIPWKPERDPQITEQDIDAYLNENREALSRALADVIQTPQRPWILRWLPAPPKRISEGAMRRLATMDVGRERIRERESREDARFGEHLRGMEDAIVRTVPILFQEDREASRVRGAYAVVIRKTALQKGERFAMTLLTDPLGESKEPLCDRLRPVLIERAISPAGDEGVRIIVGGKKKGERTHEVLLYWKDEATNVVIHGVRFAIGNVTTVPRSAKGQQWRMEGAHIQALERWILLTERGARGALVDWIQGDEGEAEA
jgi:hypothetical protein